MDSETRVCQNCKQQFVIEPEDFDFYKKINVPPPTFCPGCRFQRRLAFFNLTSLYIRPCDLCKKDMMSNYSLESPYVIYCPSCWWSDKWDPFSYGRDFDFSRPFFEQFDELHHKVPLIGLSVEEPSLVNSPYVNHAGHLKNCYLIFQADFVEDSSYGFYAKHSKSVLDTSLVMWSELCYDSMHCFKNSRCVGTRGNVTESLECAFLRDSDNCQNCFASANLRNKKYYLFNKPCSKEDYLSHISKWDLGSYKTYQEVKKLAAEHWKKFPPRPKYDDFSVNCTGSYVFKSKNCKNCFDTEGAENCKYVFMLSMPPIKDCYDVSSWGNNINLVYESCVIGQSSAMVKFCNESGINLLDAEYSKLSFGGSHHLGCVSLKKGDWCIFNKRYSEKDFKELREKIIKHMNEMPYVDKKGRTYAYGEFFPIELSPFPYNDTVAHKFFPLSKEKALHEKYLWREEDEKTHSITKNFSEIPDHIKDAPQSILQEVIGCATCQKGFKIIPLEFEFLKKMNLPLPRQCPFCRIGEKFSQWVKELRVLERTCSKCGKKFETHYPKEEAEYILCKECYLKEVV